jgi:micrococcal nuclease
MRHRPIASLLAFAVCAALVPGCAAPDRAAAPDIGPGAASMPRTVEVVVSRNVDGDTIHVTMPDGSREKVRFIGVDSPESTEKHEPFGDEAADYTRTRLPVGTRVWLETDVELRDTYGRMLAYVWLSPPGSTSAAEVRAKMFNAQLLTDGYAQLMTIPPDVRYADQFAPLLDEARQAKRGMWAVPPVP